jgi:hypothetical protein
MSDVGPSGANRFIVDRDWWLAAAGPDFVVAGTGRFGATLGVQAGALWNRNRRVGVVGTPIPPGFPDLNGGPTNWTASVALIPGARATYWVAGPVSVSASVGGLLRLFTDDVVGPPGVLGSLGLRFGW